MIPLIFLLAKSGAGKDTQGRLLIERFGVKKVSSGEVLRTIQKKDTYEAKGIRYLLENGKFVSTFTVVAHLYPFFLSFCEEASHDETRGSMKGFVFVGSMRKLMEAQLFEDFFETWPDGKYFNVMPVYISVSDHEATVRLFHRKICSGCGRIYLEDNGQGGLICLECGDVLQSRPDDTLEGIASRLKEFETFVRPVISFYQERGKLITIAGEQPVEKVHADIVLQCGLSADS